MTFLRTASIVLLLGLSVHAQPTPTATDAWAVMDGDAASVMATINNPSMYDIYIVSGSAEAEAVELVQGEKVVESITVPAFGSVELKPGGTRIRVRGLKAKLKQGDELKLKLETDGGASIEVAAIVKTPQP
jgi:copper(I)-binding protein